MYVLVDGTYLPETGSDELWQGVFMASMVSLAGSVIWPPIDAYRSAKRINAKIDQKLKAETSTSSGCLLYTSPSPRD